MDLYSVSVLNSQIVSLITAAIQLILLVCLIVKLHRNKNSQDILKSYKYIAITVFCSIFTFGISWFMSMSVFINVTFGLINDILTGFCLYLSSLLIYTLLIFRLYQTFKTSVYEVKKCIIYGHIIILTFIPISLVCIIFVHNDILIMIIDTIFYGILIIGFTHLIYAFNYRLFLLVLSQRQTLFFIDQQNITKQTELNDRQINLLKSMRKHTLLGCMMILCIFFIFLNLCLTEFLKYHSDPSIFSTWLIVYAWILTLCLNGSSLCVYLGFSVNKDYYSCLCKIGDKLCEIICIFCTQKQIKTENKYVIMEPML